MRRPRVPGSAARRAATRLRRRGFRMVARPTTFWVAGTPGPLLDGEADRAFRWGRQLAAEIGAEPPAGPRTSRPQPA